MLRLKRQMKNYAQSDPIILRTKKNTNTYDVNTLTIKQNKTFYLLNNKTANRLTLR